MAAPGNCQWPICAVRLCNTCHKLQKEESHQVDKFPLSISEILRKCEEYDTHFLQQSASVVSLTLLSVCTKLSRTLKKVGKKKEIQLRPFCRRNTSTVVRRVRLKTRHFLPSVQQKTHTHTHRTATLEFPINKVITFRNASHQNDRWFASWNIKKCLSVEIKSFITRTVTRNGGELLQYDTGDTPYS